MVQQILVADPDTAFALLFKDNLERKGLYRIVSVQDGRAALDALARDQFSMAILDLGLADPPATEVVRSIRTLYPDLPLLIIPHNGDPVPPEIGAMGIHGVLTKPFFLPNLSSMVARAMEAQPMTSAAPLPTLEEREPSAKRPAHAEASWAVEWVRNKPQLTVHLSDLARELGAEAVLLTSGGELVADAGRWTGKETEQLASTVAKGWHALATAPLPGREQVRFEHTRHEGGDYMLYSLSVTRDAVLSVALKSNIPLSLIRHHSKQTAEMIVRLTPSAQR